MSRVNYPLSVPLGIYLSQMDNTKWITLQNGFLQKLINESGHKPIYQEPVVLQLLAYLEYSAVPGVLA